MDNINNCVECGAYNGHSPKCSLMDEAYAKEMLAKYYDVWLEMETKHREYVKGLYGVIKSVKKDAEFWKGKFVVVKNENNKLRRTVSSKFKIKSKLNDSEVAFHDVESKRDEIVKTINSPEINMWRHIISYGDYGQTERIKMLHEFYIIIRTDRGFEVISRLKYN